MCSDGILNRLEEHVDCGGIYCDPCEECAVEFHLDIVTSDHRTSLIDSAVARTRVLGEELGVRDAHICSLTHVPSLLNPLL